MPDSTCFYFFAFVLRNPCKIFQILIFTFLHELVHMDVKYTTPPEKLTTELCFQAPCLLEAKESG